MSKTKRKTTLRATMKALNQQAEGREISKALNGFVRYGDLAGLVAKITARIFTRHDEELHSLRVQMYAMTRLLREKGLANDADFEALEATMQAEWAAAMPGRWPRRSVSAAMGHRRKPSAVACTRSACTRSSTTRRTCRGVRPTQRASFVVLGHTNTIPSSRGGVLARDHRANR